MHAQRRPMKDDEATTLKKIAHADAVNKGLVKQPMGTISRIQDREMVKNLRNPGKMNAMIYKNEYKGDLMKCDGINERK